MRTANVLLVYAIVFATLSAVCGIANWTEHPDLITRHAWLPAHSIWLTEQIRRLQVLPNVHLHKLQHCIYGWKTRKPTRLMTVNMEPEITEEQLKIENPQAPTGYLIGKNADGTWKTAQAKEYPKDTSAGIAAAMVRAACKHQSIQSQVIPQKALDLFALFFPKCLQFPDVFGGDFLGSIHQFIDSTCNGRHQIFIVCNVFWA